MGQDYNPGLVVFLHNCLLAGSPRLFLPTGLTHSLEAAAKTLILRERDFQLRIYRVHVFGVGVSLLPKNLINLWLGTGKGEGGSI